MIGYQYRMNIILQVRHVVLLILLLCNGFQIQSQSVYKTPSGTKYHRYECRMVDNVSKKMSLKDAAEEYGLSPCKICKPPRWNGIFRLSPDKRDKSVGKCSSVQCSGWAKTKGRHCSRMTRMCNGYCFQHNPQNDDHNAEKLKHNSIKRNIYKQRSISSRCGARTKSGGSCKRKVKNGGRCWQH